MGKILFLGAGSEKDPSFDPILKTIDFTDSHHDRDIKFTHPIVVESCHGCPDIMGEYSRQMQYLVELNEKVVGVLEGGKMFGLPSIQATQITYPIISCPLDMAAYTAFILPSGHSVISGVGIERKNPDKTYETRQRTKAIETAIKMLNLEENSVAIESDDDTSKLENMLQKFGVPISEKSRLVLTYHPAPSKLVDDSKIQVWADSSEDLTKGSYFDQAESFFKSRLSMVQVSGQENLAIYAAKILSLTNPSLIPKIKEIEKKKRASYGKEPRDLVAELGYRR